MVVIYRAYDLRLQSDRPFPGLVPLSSPAVPDVRVSFGLLPARWIRVLEKPQARIYFSPFTDEDCLPTVRVWALARGKGFRLLYRDGTEFVVSRTGSRIWAKEPGGATPADTAIYLLGPVLSFVLRLRGIMCLHASAVTVGDHAVAFVGPQGAGKSTTAALFAREGYPVLSDDVVPLVDLGDAFLAQPGYAHLRLWPDSVNMLFGAPDALPRLTPADGINAWWDKLDLDLCQHGYRFQHRPVHLGAVYLLGPASEDPEAPRVEGISARTGLMSLVANTSVNYLLGRAMRAREFEILRRVVDRVPIRRVVFSAAPTPPGRLRDVILSDVSALISVSPGYPRHSDEANINPGTDYRLAGRAGLSG